MNPVQRNRQKSKRLKSARFVNKFLPFSHCNVFFEQSQNIALGNEYWPAACFSVSENATSSSCINTRKKYNFTGIYFKVIDWTIHLLSLTCSKSNIGMQELLQLAFLCCRYRWYEKLSTSRKSRDISFSFQSFPLSKCLYQKINRILFS